MRSRLLVGVILSVALAMPALAQEAAEPAPATAPNVEAPPPPVAGETPPPAGETPAPPAPEAKPSKAELKAQKDARKQAERAARAEKKAQAKAARESTPAPAPAAETPAAPATDAPAPAAEPTPAAAATPAAPVPDAEPTADDRKTQREAERQARQTEKEERKARKKIRRGKVPPAPVVDYTVPPPSPENMWDIDLSNGGKVVVQMRPDKAPQMVARIRQLTCSNFYDGLAFHRVIEGFMAQGGDPLGTGEGGSTLPDVPAEFNDLPHVRGTAAAARAASEDSANSQFYIMLQPNLRLDKHYTVFGRVVSGMPSVDAIQKGEPPANPTRVVRATIEGGCAGVQIVNARPAPIATTTATVPPAAADGSPGTGPTPPGF